jgi:SET domain-containing protein
MVTHGELESGIIDKLLCFHFKKSLRPADWNHSLAVMVKYPKKPSLVKQVNPFCEVRQSSIHGRGVFASRKIRKGTRIIQYIGELIDKDESNRRGLALLEESRETGGAAVYIFDLNEKWDLDGNKEYNDARLINHSCEPNSEMVNEEDELWLYALRDILPNEEISFDYGYDIEHFLEHPCRCGTDSCVGYIVASSDRGKLKKRLKRIGRKKAAKS